MSEDAICFSRQKPGKHVNLRMKDGTTYNGTIVCGERNGLGLFRSTPLIYGAVRSKTGEELIHWTEYYGEWRDDMPHGFGILRNVSGDGNVRNVFEGSWLKGIPESSAFYGL
jgi:hypothetical protein